MTKAAASSYGDYEKGAVCKCQKTLAFEFIYPTLVSIVYFTGIIFQRAAMNGIKIISRCFSLTSPDNFGVRAVRVETSDAGLIC